MALVRSFIKFYGVGNRRHQQNCLSRLTTKKHNFLCYWCTYLSERQLVCVCTDLPLAHVVGVFAINWIKLNGLDGIRVLYFLAHVMM